MALNIATNPLNVDITQFEKEYNWVQLHQFPASSISPVGNAGEVLRTDNAGTTAIWTPDFKSDANDTQSQRTATSGANTVTLKGIITPAAQVAQWFGSNSGLAGVSARVGVQNQTGAPDTLRAQMEVINSATQFANVKVDTNPATLYRVAAQKAALQTFTENYDASAANNVHTKVLMNGVALAQQLMELDANLMHTLSLTNGIGVSQTLEMDSVSGSARLSAQDGLKVARLTLNTTLNTTRLSIDDGGGNNCAINLDQTLGIQFQGAGTGLRVSFNPAVAPVAPKPAYTAVSVYAMPAADIAALNAIAGGSGTLGTDLAAFITNVKTTLTELQNTLNSASGVGLAA